MQLTLREEESPVKARQQGKGKERENLLGSRLSIPAQKQERPLMGLPFAMDSIPGVAMVRLREIDVTKDFTYVGRLGAARRTQAINMLDGIFRCTPAVGKYL